MLAVGKNIQVLLLIITSKYAIYKLKITEITWIKCPTKFYSNPLHRIITSTVKHENIFLQKIFENWCKKKIIYENYFFLTYNHEIALYWSVDHLHLLFLLHLVTYHDKTAATVFIKRDKYNIQGSRPFHSSIKWIKKFQTYLIFNIFILWVLILHTLKFIYRI